MDQNNNTTTNNNNNNQQSIPNDNINNVTTPSIQQDGLLYEKQLLNAYFKNSIDNTNAITEMASILTTLFQTTSTTPITSTSTPPSDSTNMQRFSFKSFMELRSNYIGPINNTFPNTNTSTNFIDDTSTPQVNDDIYFNVSLFHAALLTNTPSIINSIMEYINYDFTTLDIPHDQIDIIEKRNAVGKMKSSDPLDGKNYILQAIVDATMYGHYESIQHLIQNYQLSPTIHIYDPRFRFNFRVPTITNLFHYAALQNNLQLLEYLIPFYFPSTIDSCLGGSICKIARYGYLHLIQRLKNEYNVNLINIPNILRFAVQSNNIELIDYLIDVIGIAPDEDIFKVAFYAYQWDIVKHLINKYNVDISLVHAPLDIAAHSENITPDIIDYIITTFSIIDENDINMPQKLPPFAPTQKSPLFPLAQTGNIIAMKHLITKYHVDPNYKYFLYEHSESLLDCVLVKNKIKSLKLEMLEYIYELGLQVTLKSIILAIKSQCTLPIFKSLLEHYDADDNDVVDMMKNAVDSWNWQIVEYLFQTNQLDFNHPQLQKLNLLEQAVCYQPSIDFITYLLSLPQTTFGLTPLHRTSALSAAIRSNQFNLDIIQRFIENGTEFTIHNWLASLTIISSKSNPCDVFNWLDYCKNIFGFDIYNFASFQGPRSPNPSPLLCLSSLTPSNGSKSYAMSSVLIYRALIYRYKANVNDQDSSTKNTIFHHVLTQGYQTLRLIPFILLHSHYPPNLFLVNKQNYTLLHSLISSRSYDQNVEQLFPSVFESIVDLLVKEDGNHEYIFLI